MGEPGSRRSPEMGAVRVSEPTGARTRLIVASLGVAALLSDSGNALQTTRSAAPRESRVDVGKASLYCREIGRGQPLIILHGGPDFDHGYLLPDLDRLADAYRLLYYGCSLWSTRFDTRLECPTSS
jgi:hypothetical protein